MPELPEVEHAARVLRVAALGKTVRDVRVLHRAQRRHLPSRAVARVRGARIVGVDRRGKHQLLSLSTGDTLVVHFRMTGDWLVDDVIVPVPKYARVAIELDDGARISHTRLATAAREQRRCRPNLQDDAPIFEQSAACHHRSGSRRRARL